MSKIYVPTKEYNCYVVYDSETIRAYHTAPQENSNIDYTDYFVNSNYMEKIGNQRFNYTTPVCLNKDVLTTDVWYRNDISDIYVLVFIIFFFVILIPAFLIKNVFWK